MRTPPTCPRCGGDLRAPGVWSSAWRCSEHGDVLPFVALPTVGAEALEHLRGFARVPVWLPWPLPAGWLVSGLGYVGDERSGGRATVVACSGPAPLGGPADMVLVAEEPGTGVGAWYAGLPGPDPGPEVGVGPPAAKVEAAGHPTALWNLPASSGCAALAGEARGLWLWVVLWPTDAGVLLVEQMTLRDVRAEAAHVPAFGARTPRLSTPGR